MDATLKLMMLYTRIFFILHTTLSTTTTYTLSYIFKIYYFYKCVIIFEARTHAACSVQRSLSTIFPKSGVPIPDTASQPLVALYPEGQYAGIVDPGISIVPS